MRNHRLSLIAMLACLHAATLAARDRAEFGSLPQAGNAAQRLPGGEKSTFGGMAPALSGQAKLPSTLERINVLSRQK